MKRIHFAFLALLAFGLAACNLGVTPTAAPTATEIVLPTNTEAPTLTSTDTPDLTALAPTDTPEPTETPAPTEVEDTATPTATATLPPVDPETQFGDPTIRDELNNDGNWAPASGNLPNTDNILLALGGGQLHITAKQPGFDTWWFTWPSAGDQFIQMTVETDACSGKAAYGLILRGPEEASNARGYVLLFSCDGSYRLARLDDTSPYTLVDLIPWTESDRIVDGANEVNKMGVHLDGDVITIYANGFEIDQIEDDRYSSGRFGIFTNAGPESNFLWHMDQLLYWNLD